MVLAPHIKLAVKFVFIVFLSALFFTSDAKATELEKLKIYVPGSKGGGFDKAAIAIKDTLLAENLVKEIELLHSPGAGGIISLASFIRADDGDTPSVFLGGRTNIGASVFNRSDVSLLGTKPIANLIGPGIVIAVSQNSSIQDLSDLVSVYRSNPKAVKWIGGSMGSQDELLLLEISQSMGVNRREIVYQSIPGGGSDIITEVLEGRADVLLSSYEELKDAIELGELRVVTSVPESANNLYNTATFSKYNINLSGHDWKGIFAPKSMSEDLAERIDFLFRKMVETESWKDKLAANRWDDLYQSSEAFRNFVQSETNSVKAFRANYAVNAPQKNQVSGILAEQFRWLITALSLVVLLVGFLFLQRHVGKRRERELEKSLFSAEEELEGKLDDARNHIDEKFKKWRLTESENEIGWLLLKGLSFKEIADVRGTSERTGRQQARSIYAKSGLSSRSDLSAFFLEDFVFGRD